MKYEISVCYVLRCVSLSLTMAVTITAWNMKGLSVSIPYANTLLSESNVCVFTEHHLYQSELHKLHTIHKDFEVYARSASGLNCSMMNSVHGHGGIAIMWRSSIDHVISRCSDMGNDRIMVIMLEQSDGCKMFIIGVYLPQRQCYIDSFDVTVDLLHSVVSKCNNQGNVLIIGDMNSNYGPEFGQRLWCHE